MQNQGYSTFTGHLQFANLDNFFFNHDLLISSLFINQVSRKQLTKGLKLRY